MSTQKQKQKTKRRQDPAPEQEQKVHDTTATTDLLDEIDETLEKNAEEFVKAYVQKGGQAWVWLVLVGSAFLEVVRA